MRRTNLIPNEVISRQTRFTFKTQSDYLLFLAFVIATAVFIVVFLFQLINRGILSYQVGSDSKRLQHSSQLLEKNKKSKEELDVKIKNWQEKTKQAQDRIVFLDEAVTQDIAWSNILEKLNTLIPARLWLVKLSLSADLIKIKGNTYDNLLISTFISNLANSGSFSDINLNYTQKKKLRQEPESAISEEVMEFELTCKLIKG